MSDFVLDASALLALLNDETGAKRVLEVLPKSVISSVNLCETVGKLVNAGMMPDDIARSLDLLGLQVHTFDKSAAHSAGALIAQTKQWELSLGDRAAIALGMELKRKVITADQIWLKLKLDVEIECIRRVAAPNARRRKNNLNK